MPHSTQLLHLLQLASAALPVGAYSYSEGLETLVETGAIASVEDLRRWLEQELAIGAINLDAAAMVRAYRAAAAGDAGKLRYWNAWLSAARDAEELRQQSWQMGWSLSRLLGELMPPAGTLLANIGSECNYAIAFGVGCQQWQIELDAAVLGYLHSWTSNAIAAGVKLIPLGQTSGQQLLVKLHAKIESSASEIVSLDDGALQSCGWGIALASMAHETQYSRLFRS